MLLTKSPKGFIARTQSVLLALLPSDTWDLTIEKLIPVTPLSLSGKIEAHSFK